MKKYTKILAAIAAAAAIISCTACGNKTESSSTADSSSVSEAADNSSAADESVADDSAADESVADDSAADESVADDGQAAATQEQAAGTVEQAAPSAEADANAEGSDIVSKMMGSWVLAGINGMDLNTYGEAVGLTAEDLMVVVTIDENGYTSKSSTGEATYAYTATENGIAVPMTDEFTLNVLYIEEADSIVYVIAGADADGNEVQIQYTFMRNE